MHTDCLKIVLHSSKLRSLYSLLEGLVLEIDTSSLCRLSSLDSLQPWPSLTVLLLNTLVLKPWMLESFQVTSLNSFVLDNKWISVTSLACTDAILFSCARSVSDGSVSIWLDSSFWPLSKWDAVAKEEVLSSDTSITFFFSTWSYVPSSLYATRYLSARPIANTAATIWKRS